MGVSTSITCVSVVLLYLSAFVACLNQPVHHHRLRCGSADTCSGWTSHTGPSLRNLLNEQTSQPVKLFLSFFCLFQLLFSLHPPCVFFVFVLALIRIYDKASLGSLVWRGVTGLAMQQSPVEHGHIHTCGWSHIKWGAALTSPKWAFAQTAIRTTALQLRVFGCINMHRLHLCNRF